MLVTGLLEVRFMLSVPAREHQAHQSAVFVCLIVQVAEFAVCKDALNFFAIVS